MNTNPLPHPAPLPRCWLQILFAVIAGAAAAAVDPAKPWPRHTIDNASRGADGVRMADANGDGLPDIVTGWEEGGVVRVYLHPGPAKVKARWPAVTVGKARAVEDAVLVDLDGDGALDVVSSCEGNVKTMLVHWAPSEKDRYLDPAAWKTEPLPASANRMQWMFCLPLQVDGRHGPDLFAAGKGASAQAGWFEAPARPRQLADWKWHPLHEVGWVMSLVASDMDGDGDSDVLVSDRKGTNSGCFWLENPAPAAGPAGRWPRHPIGGAGREVMFLVQADLDRDGLQDVIVAAKPRDILFFRRQSADGRKWATHSITHSANTGSMKAVNAGDIDLDGRLDLVFTCEGATAPKSGVIWLACRNSLFEETWDAREISGADGVKHDLVQLIDLDADGDLDVITCEESRNLGVFWYENPARSGR